LPATGVLQAAAQLHPLGQDLTNALLVGIRELMADPIQGNPAGEIEKLGTGQEFLLRRHNSGSKHLVAVELTARCTRRLHRILQSTVPRHQY